jgi:predicted transcriptional regulator
MSRLEGVIKRIGHETTPTEIHALKILATEGAKTSKELHGRVGRSREHFARLMKKLYERGYVDRDTSKTPFVYAINDGIAERVLEVTEQVAGESIGQSSDAPLFPLKHEDDHMEAH